MQSPSTSAKPASSPPRLIVTRFVDEVTWLIWAISPLPSATTLLSRVAPLHAQFSKLAIGMGVDRPGARLLISSGYAAADLWHRSVELFVSTGVVRNGGFPSPEE